MATLDQNIFDMIPVKVHLTEQAAADDFARLGQSATGPVPKWLFRGQVKRYPLRKWPPVAEPPVKKHAFEMEQLIPSDYRDLERRLEGGESKKGLEPIYGDRVARLRSLLTTYLMQYHSAWGDPSVQSWYTALQPDNRADKMLSIGQHYRLKTHLMDWSADWAVALWFASHNWDTGDYVQDGDGVIYQIKVDGLVKVEAKANKALNVVGKPKEMCRHVDIRDTPAILAPRALAQRGFSIANLESPVFLQELINQKAITVHVFSRSTVSSPSNKLTKLMLVPPLDPMADLYDKARKGSTFFRQAIQWLHRNYPTLAPTTNDHGLIFA